MSNNDFVKAVRQMSEKTGAVKVVPNDIIFMHYLHESISNDAGCYILDETGMLNPSSLEEEPLPQNYGHKNPPENLLCEAICLPDYARNHFTFASEAMPIFLQNIGINGEAIRNNKSVWRNAFIVDSFRRKHPNRVVFVYRTDEQSNNIIYYVGWGRYNYIPQSEELLPIIEYIETDDYLGKSYLASWEVNNMISTCYYEFPDEAENIAKTYGRRFGIPGIIVTTSDVGASALKAQATLNVAGHLVVLEEVSERHCSKAEDLTSFIDNFKNNINKTLYKKVRQYPQKLVELCSVDIAADNVVEVLQDAVKMTYPKKIVPAKMEKIYALLEQEIIPGETSSAYDIAELIMAVPDLIQINELDKKYLQSSAAEAPFCVEKALKNVIIASM